MSNPVSDAMLSPEEMRGLCDHAQETMKQTDAFLTGTSFPDIGQHMSALESAESGVEHVENDLQKRIGDLKNSLGAVSLLKKDLKRHWERSKRKYWEIRKATPSS